MLRKGYLIGHPYHMANMTNVTHGRVPRTTLGIRLRMSLGAREARWMARQLGVGPSTVSRWMSDQNVPRPGMIRAWATITDVDYDWLLTGQDPGQQNLAA